LLTLSREEAAAAPGDDVRLDELAHAAGADRVDAESVTVPGDRAALERTLSNLVENARRHGRGAVTITVRADGDRALLSVEDEGEGVPPADRDRVFERFYGNGSGLGLAGHRRAPWRSRLRRWRTLHDRARQESFRVR
jgi:signal transduction histidine kinase